MATALAAFSPDPQREQAKTKLVALGLNSDYGTTFAYEFLEIETGFKRQRLYGLINGANKHLLLEKKMFLNVRTEGYKVALPREQMVHSDGRRLKANRQLRRGYAEAQFLDTTKLSNDERARHTHLLNKLSSCLAVIRKPAQATVESIDALSAQLESLRKKLEG